LLPDENQGGNVNKLPYAPRMTTRLYTHPIYLEHITPPGHPERPDRLRALDRIESPRGSEESILLAHPESFLAKVAGSIPESGMARIDGDTVASPKSFEAAMYAIGAATNAVDAVFSGKASNAFVAARPPGHHAERETAMGFCFFNTAAIAAHHAQEEHGAERVAIVDWDVHHGNGTQDIFWDDQSVLFCSTHQMPLYPGTGARKETGEHNTIVNAPMAPQSDGKTFREAFDELILPALDAFSPDLIIISAGFDAHHRDPLAEINLEEDDFDWATGKLMDRAGKFASNRLVSLLEGGYDLQGLSLSASAHVRRLMRG
jgi:acetoin utilization deacetylase AcuC-like enzyme